MAGPETPAPEAGASASAASAATAERSRTVTSGGILRNLAATYVQTGVSLVISLATTPIYLRYLGLEVYGLWITGFSFVTYFNLSGAGFPQAAANRVASDHAAGRSDRAALLLSTAVWVTMALSLLGGAIGAALVAGGVISPSLFLGSPEVQRLAIPLLLVMGAGQLLAMPLEQFRGALRAFQRVDVEQGLMTLSRIVSLGAALAALSLGGGVLGLAAIHVGITLAIGAASVALVHRLLPRGSFRLLRFDKQAAMELVSPSLHFLLLAVSGAIIWSTDNLVISSHLGTAAVTPYAVTVSLLTTVTGFVIVGTSALTPSITALWSTGDLDRLRRLMSEVLRVVMALTLMFVIELGFHGREFVGLWAGPSAVAPFEVFAVLLAIFFIRTFAYCFSLLLVATSRHQRYAYVVVIEGALNLGISLLLVRRVGVLGVALGTLIAHLLGSGVFLPWQGARQAGIRWRQILRGVMLPLMLPGTAAVAIAYVLRRIVPGGGWAGWAGRCGVVALAFCGAYALLGLNEWERALLRRGRAALAGLGGRAGSGAGAGPSAPGTG